MGYRIFLDSFSGALADLKRGQRTTENALAVLKKSPMVSTWDMSENKWLWRLVCDLKEAGLIIELEQPYPWHRYALTDKGMALLPPNALGQGSAACGASPAPTGYTAGANNGEQIAGPDTDNA